MVAFYSQYDQDIYDKGIKFRPQQKYLLNKYTPPVSEVEKVQTTFGIPATNAFTGGNTNFNFQSGNAFGYGSPVSEVNVRTFNPQSNDPTGLVANAQGIYNQAAQASASGYFPGYTDGSMLGKSLSEIQSMANNQIMDNKEQYGAQGQYISPYDDTVDQSKYTTTIGSFPSQAFFNRLRNKGVNLVENLPYIGPATKLLKGFLPPKEDRGPGGGTYGIAGLTDAQKTQYNALAKAGMLFSGNQGFKTLTGKNFTGKGYLEGQLDLYNEKGFDQFTEDEEGEVYDASGKKVTGFLKKQYLEASNMYKTTKELEKKQKEEFDKPGGTGEQVADIQKRIDAEYEAQKKRDGKDFSVSGADTSDNPTGKSNQASAERGYALHGADGGRAIFKYGGLASIL